MGERGDRRHWPSGNDLPHRVAENNPLQRHLQRLNLMDPQTSGKPVEGLQSYRPTVYLDQWVWIRMARAASGKPDTPSDREFLDALVAAANSGVAFPLSWTHSIETEGIKNKRQCRDVADVMAAVSHFRTIRSRRDLLRNQLLVAMHEQFGRPTFRPQNLGLLGIGIHWAFQGVEKTLQVHDANGAVIEVDQIPNPPPPGGSRAYGWRAR